MNPIQEITICLHCGCDTDVVARQMNLLEPLKEKYRIHWNNRIMRYPYAYPSYSQLMNHTIATSPTEFMLMVNDRTIPTVAGAEKMIQHMRSGFALSMLYNVGYMMFSKSLIRRIGWWDERFKLGGWEDRDFIMRTCMADLAIYESQEVEYDQSWKSPLQVIGHNCTQSEPHFRKKYILKEPEGNIFKMIPEETYEHWNLFLRYVERVQSENLVESSWKPWKDSILNIGFDGPTSGPSTSSLIGGRKIVCA